MNVNQTLPTKKFRRRRKSEVVKYHCNYCGTDISNVLRIKCAICPDFDLCISCFSVGVEISSHKANHDYHVMDILNFPLLDEEWGADEELLLLEGIELYGLGNWGDVSDHVGTKTPQECKDHYFDYYINVRTAPLPDLSNILTTSEMLQQRHLYQFFEEDEVKLEETTPKIEKREVRSTRNTVSAKKLCMDESPNHHVSIGYSYPELAGWMPLRGDFETDYQNDAEQVLADMSFSQEDSPEDREAKLKLIEIYNKKLDERIKRKKFILERDLLDYKKIERKRGKEDKDIYDRCRVFARVTSKDEYEKLIQGFINERKFRKSIETLKKYRYLGIHTLAEAELYEKEKKKRDEEKSIKQKDQSPYMNRNLSQEKISTSSLISSSPKGVTKNFSLKLTKDNKKLDTLLDIDNCPGSDLLSDKEKNLCLQLKLYPHQYMVIKDTFLRESLRVNYLTKETAKQLIKIDITKTEKIFDFFEESGWINKPEKDPRMDGDALPPIFISSSNHHNQIEYNNKNEQNSTKNQINLQNHNNINNNNNSIVTDEHFPKTLIMTQ